MIASIGLNSELGKDNKLLVKHSKDLKRFKELTLNKTIVVGRKTFESILNYNDGKPLPNRTHIILSKNKSKSFNPDCYVYNSVQDLLIDYFVNRKYEEIWVCGGESIYKEFLPYANEIYLTIFHKKFPEADTYFPPFRIEEWEVKENIHHQGDNEIAFGYNFVVYKRKLNKEKFF